MVVVVVLYIVVNVDNHPWLVITGANQFTGLILPRMGCGQLVVHFYNKFCL